MIYETIDENSQSNQNTQNSQKSVIIDACVNGNIGNYLEQMEYEVFYVSNKNPMMEDDEIKRLGYEMDAVIITADRRGFRDYKNIILVRSWASPDNVYKKLCDLLPNDSPEPHSRT